MFETIIGAIGISKITAYASGGVLVAMINFLFSKLKVDQKILKWTETFEIKYEDWLDKILSGSGAFFYNLGVMLTGWQKTKVGKTIWQLVEPLLILVLGMVKTILVLTLEKLVVFVSMIVRKFIDGLRSDNLK